ncbi:hypothetical protein [Paraburkholderia sp. 2C]
MIPIAVDTWDEAIIQQLPEVTAVNSTHPEETLPAAMHDAAAPENECLPVAQDGTASDQEAEDTAGIVQTFVHAYEHNRSEVSDEEWLKAMFRRHRWADDAEMDEAARQVVSTVGLLHQKKADLHESLDRGATRSNWLAKELDRVVATKGATDVAFYTTDIERAITQATGNSAAVVQRLDGEISLCMNLDGFIAEQHHVDTFNIDAAAKGSPLRARVLSPAPGNPYTKNSVDIGIYDGNGKLIGRYQCKYGADAEATQTCFDRGDYRGQKKLVPEGQSKDIPGSTEVIEADGVTSTPLSKEDAKRQQQAAQQEQETRQYEWKDANRITIAKQIGKQALFAAAIACAMQGARILGTRAWNSLRGKKNPPFSEAMNEFFQSSVKSGAHAGLMVAVVGGIVVAVKNGWLGTLVKNTPAGRIANIVFIGMENAKILYKLGRGELSAPEALEAMAETTTVALASLAAAAEGTLLGAEIGMVFGPWGALVGGFVGGLVGGFAGGTVARTMFAAQKAVAKAATHVLKDVASVAADGVRHAAKAVASVFSAVFA